MTFFHNTRQRSQISGKHRRCHDLRRNGSAHVTSSFSMLGLFGQLLILSPGDQYSYIFLDQTGLVGAIKGACTSATTRLNSYPSGYILETITCSSYIFTSPGGAVLPHTIQYPILCPKLANSVTFCPSVKWGQMVRYMTRYKPTPLRLVISHGDALHKVS
jgi:hypothetical protein